MKARKMTMASLLGVVAGVCVQDNFTNISVGKNFSLPRPGHV